MRIGIFFATHDNLPKIEKAAKLFNQKKVDFVLHAGGFRESPALKYLNYNL